MKRNNAAPVMLSPVPAPPEGRPAFAPPPHTPGPAFVSAATQEALHYMDDIFTALCRLNPDIAGISFRRPDGAGGVFYTLGGCNHD